MSIKIDDGSDESRFVAEDVLKIPVDVIIELNTKPEMCNAMLDAL